MANIAQTRNEVDRCVRATLDAVENAEESTAHEAEEAVWACLLLLGRALMAWFFARRSAASSATIYKHAGLAYEIVGAETIEVGTRFGKVELRRPVARVVGMERWARDFPLDRQLGLVGGFTLAVVATIVAGKVAFVRR